MRPMPELFDPLTLVIALGAALVVATAVIAVALAVGALLDRLVVRQRDDSTPEAAERA